MRRLSVLFCCFLAGCAVFGRRGVESGVKIPPIETIRIERFACSCPDPYTPQSVQTVLASTLMRYGRVAIVESGPADCVIDGVITFTESSTARGRASGFTGNVATDASAGKYATFVTIRAMRGGTLLATGTSQQVVGTNAAISPPEILVQRAFTTMIRELYRNGMRKR
jgi:hypothetical protein